MAKIPCPILGYDEKGDSGDPKYYVTIPDEWFMVHRRAHQDSMDAVKDALHPAYHEFSHSLAIADDYQLPGLTGKRENWDFANFSLDVMAWVNFTVFGSYLDCFTVKKNWLRPSLNGSNQ